MRVSSRGTAGKRQRQRSVGGEKRRLYTRQQSGHGNLHVVGEHLYVAREENHRAADHEQSILRNQLEVSIRAQVEATTNLAAPFKHVSQWQVRHENVIHPNGVLHLQA